MTQAADPYPQFGSALKRRLYPVTQSPQRGAGSGPQGMIGTVEVEFFGEPSIGRSEYTR